MEHEYTVSIARGNEGNEVFATYLRDGQKIALSLTHPSLMDEVNAWVLEGKMPRNGTFYRW